MAGDGNRINYTTEEIMTLLCGYNDLKKEAAALNKADYRLNFLEHCLDCLDDYERDILQKTCIDGLSVRKYSSYTGFSRNFINKHRTRSVELLTKFFNLKFGV